eukprot:s1005_g35.t2
MNHPDSIVNFQSQPAAQVAARTQPSDGESQDESPRNFQSQPAAKAAAARTWPSDGSESQDESPRSPKNQAAEKALAARNQPVAAATAARLPPRDSPQQNQPSPPTIAAPKRPASPPCFEASDDEDPLDRTGLGSALRVPMAPAMPRNQPSPPTIAVPKRSMSPKREVNRPRPASPPCFEASDDEDPHDRTVLPASPPCFEASDDEDPHGRTGFGSTLRVPIAPAMQRNQPSPPTSAAPKRSMSPKREVNSPRPASPPCFEASDDEDPHDRTSFGGTLRAPMAPAMPRTSENGGAQRSPDSAPARTLPSSPAPVETPATRHSLPGSAPRRQEAQAPVIRNLPQSFLQSLGVVETELESPAAVRNLPPSVPERLGATPPRVSEEARPVFRNLPSSFQQSLGLSVPPPKANEAGPSHVARTVAPISSQRLGAAPAESPAVVRNLPPSFLQSLGVSVPSADASRHGESEPHAAAARTPPSTLPRAAAVPGTAESLSRPCGAKDSQVPVVRKSTGGASSTPPSTPGETPAVRNVPPSAPQRLSAAVPSDSQPAVRRIVAEALSPQNALAGWARVGIQPNELMQKHVVLEERFSELFTSKKSGGGSLPAPQTSTANALSLVSQISPKKKKCGQNSCKCMIAVTMRFCPECASPNAHFDQEEADMFRSGRRKGWHKPPESDVPQLPETAEERRLAQGVGDLLGRLRRGGGAAQSEDASSKPSQKGEGVAEIQEPPAKQQKTQHIAASSSKPSTLELVPEPLGEDEDASDPEWNLNDPDDCCSFIEHHFPAKEAESLGVSIDMFSKIAKFYVTFLRTKRTPRADLCVHFAIEMTEPKTLNSKAGRKNWLKTWLMERKRVFVPKTK